MAETALKDPRQRKTDHSNNRRQQNQRLQKIIGAILSLVMVALTIYVFGIQNQNYHTLSRSSDLSVSASTHQATNYRSYVKGYKQVKMELEETTKKLEAVTAELDQVSAELATTKGMLSETQGMLASAQAENSKLKTEIQ